jgi:NAD(P)-dependent dehydrogenase (short-subunit alcohol dehydrogenase family)
MNDAGHLRDLVCVVTGASRGAGRGIAVELGARGAAVYVTGRTLGATGGERGSLEETVEQVRGAGGVASAVRCDHTREDEVAALFARVARDQGRLDVLVNNAWGGYEQRGPDVPFFDAPFWEQPLWRWDAMFTAGVRATFLSTKYAAPLLIAERSENVGLIVNTLAWAFGAYLGNVVYDTAKAATGRLAFGMAEELRGHRVAAVALALGHLGVSESPRYGGRAIAALARDPDLMNKSGQLLTAGGLAREYDFTDIDGTQPEPFALPNEQ